LLWEVASTRGVRKPYAPRSAWYWAPSVHFHFGAPASGSSIAVVVTAGLRKV
jgi:hypothetical protein